ncbi:MAG: cold shock domain-containing protein [Saprospiraceae bacterium]|nr:cold shock domain-containing protein [Saprospiraceae bacterium]
MLQGIVQFYLLDKQYGYIRVDGSLEEIYFSGKNSNIIFCKGDRVSFTIKEDKHGLTATGVIKI